MPRMSSARLTRSSSRTPRWRAARASCSMRSRRSRSTSMSHMMLTTARAAAAAWEASGSRTQASRAAPKTASAGLLCSPQCLMSARRSARAAAELLATAAPWMAVPKVTAVGTMLEDSMRSRRSRISEKRPASASDFKAMLYETTFSEMPRDFISLRMAVVALALARSPWLSVSSGAAPWAQFRRALYVARGILSRKPWVFIFFQRIIAVRPFGGRDFEQAVMAAWYSGTLRRSTGRPSITANGVR
mmetsp:Transcript_13783/g.41683  ORF Transcript_13783/g.41683 Transcript_13783/m.41683 type:complete len:246 (+) Transcript_13783:221-958(+)